MIQAKPKPCSGIGKAKGVKGCKKETPYRTFGLCASCLSDFIFSTDAGKLIFEKRIIPKAKAKVKAEQRLKDGLTHEKLKTKTDRENDLQKEINTIVRLIDRGAGCHSTGKPLNDKYDAGHVLSRGANPTIRFHLMNIYSQSVHANQYLSGDQINFLARLSEVYGSEHTEYVLSLKSRYNALKLSQGELIEKTKIARQIVKELKSSPEHYVFAPERRIELRRIYNERIGIYPDCELTPKISKKCG